MKSEKFILNNNELKVKLTLFERTAKEEENIQRKTAEDKRK